MPVPSLITDLSTTPASNSPSGSEAPTEGDNHLRTAYAFIKQLYDGVSGVAYPTLAQLASTASATDGDALVGVLWTGTPGVATTSHQVNEDRPTLMMSLADSLKAAIRALTSTDDITTQFFAYHQYCYDNKKEAILPPGQFSIQPGTVTVDGGNFDKGLKITGAGQNVTRIKKIGSSSSPLITIQTASPTTDAPISIQLMMRDLTIDGANETGPGLALAAVAAFHIENVGITDTTVGIDLQSSLIGTVQKCKIVSNQIGVRSRKTGVAYCNHLTLRDNQITNNTLLGLDIGACDTLNLYDNQIEQNGAAQSTSTVTISNATPAVVTWNSHGRVAEDPVFFTTSGALPTGLVINYCYYVSATGLTTNTFQVSATPGGSSIATSSAGSGTHTAYSPTKGAIVIRDTCVDELGSAVFNLQGNRFEGNLGCDLRTEYMSTAFGATLHLEASQMAGTSDGPMILIGYMRKVEISHCWAPVGTSTWNICCEQGQLENVEVINFVRPRVQPSDGRAYWTITNARFGGTDHISGEKVSWTASLTACSTVPTASVTSVIQGGQVSHTIPAITGTSTGATATLTGMPRDLWPSITKGFISKSTDNGTEKLSEMSIGTGGVVTLFNGLTSVFTASGTKGHSLTNGTYTYDI